MHQLLTQGLTQWDLPTQSIPALERFSQLLLEKNQVMNLTAITAPKEVATLHLLDSAAIVKYFPLQGKRVVDIGTGAGFPGMVLRLLEPDFDLTLLDSLGKRIDWLKEVCAALELSRVECIHARAEDHAGKQRESYDIAVSRAVAQLSILCELALPLVSVGGSFLAMKSVNSEDELAQAKGAIDQLGGRVQTCVDYTIPGTEITHRIIAIEKIRPTPRVYPRAFAKIKKNPLA